MSDDEGTDIEASVQKWMKGFGRVSAQQRLAETEARLKAERRAGMTPKQRAKRAKKTESLNFRCSPELRALADALVAKLECGISEMLEKAVLKLADREGMKVQK
jgi:hypothetical protein